MHDFAWFVSFFNQYVLDRFGFSPFNFIKHSFLKLFFFVIDLISIFHYSSSMMFIILSFIICEFYRWSLIAFIAGFIRLLCYVRLFLSRMCLMAKLMFFCWTIYFSECSFISIARFSVCFKNFIFLWRVYPDRPCTMEYFIFWLHLPFERSFCPFSIQLIDYF